LRQNYPNPFNPVTTIEYSLGERSHVTLRIYNVAGQLVRTLIDDVRVAALHTATWDGQNDAGQGVASGVYFYRLQSAGFVQTKKMVLLK
ncbi:MAG: T9SS type A sorting domain-containing protein, partial [Candidatus Krumholzibacteriota bacterium]|nr:T9SS type A sorting domain-containing protein [Candidatus Krumholzibacteriota bacterium]